MPINCRTPVAGAPIDFHAAEPVVHEVLRRLSPGGDLRFYEALVKADGGVLKGEHMVSGFVLIQPGAEISRQIDLLLHLDDEHHVARYCQFEDWFKHTQDVPGGFYLWIIRHLFRDNGLIDGAITIRGRRVDLANISIPLYLLAGATDHIPRPTRCSRSPTSSRPRPSSSARTSPPADISDCSWATKRCVNIGRRS